MPTKNSTTKRAADAPEAPQHDWSTSQKWAQLYGELEGTVATLNGELDRVQTQRDELLAACKAVSDEWDSSFKGQDTGYENTPLHSVVKKCKRAIASVERGS